MGKVNIIKAYANIHLGRFKFLQLPGVTETEQQLGAENRERRISVDLANSPGMKYLVPGISVMALDFSAQCFIV